MPQPSREIIEPLMPTPPRKRTELKVSINLDKKKHEPVEWMDEPSPKKKSQQPKPQKKNKPILQNKLLEALND